MPDTTALVPVSPKTQTKLEPSNGKGRPKKPRFKPDGSPLKPGGAPQCTARTSASGYTKRCQRYAVHSYGYTVCQMHGAGSPGKGRPGGGPPKWGPYRLPRDMQQRFEKAMGDPKLLDLSREIVLTREHMTELVENIFSDEAKLARGSLLRGAAIIKEAEQLEDGERKASLLIEALNLISSSFDDVKANMELWDQFSGMAHNLSRLTEKEINRRKALNNYITAEQAMGLIDALVHDVKEIHEEFVPDPKHRRQMLNALQARIMLRVVRPGAAVDL